MASPPSKRQRLDDLTSDASTSSRQQTLGDSTAESHTPTKKHSHETDEATREAPNNTPEPNTRSSPTPAADAVLVSPELLELILLKLDSKTLLLSQRTSHTFQAVIAGSPRLQKKVFFRAAATIDEALILGEGEDIGKPLVRQSGQSGEWSLLNPLLFEHVPGAPSGAGRFRIPDRGSSAAPSWKRMRCCSPPPASVFVVLVYADDMGRGYDEVTAWLRRKTRAATRYLLHSVPRGSGSKLKGVSFEIDGDVVSIRSWVEHETAVVREEASGGSRADAPS
ncbi:hypothetical protein LTR53_007654 [Teratosphaeriaceae sp. CCFEE 6253]|nr:hypothetical protein LTR53_007654 [Teratosphaeriaceae sp. CCFEE 6253]